MHRNAQAITARNDETVKSPQERGTIGAWAYAARQVAELTVEDVVERLRDRGHAIHPATLRGIEGGTKKPGRALLRGLADIYGVPPPVEERMVESVDLASALDRQTRVIERLAVAIEQMVVSQAQTTQPPPQEVLREVAEAEADLARQLDSEKQRRSADQPRSGEGSSGLPRPRE